MARKNAPAHNRRLKGQKEHNRIVGEVRILSDTVELEVGGAGKLPFSSWWS